MLTQCCVCKKIRKEGGWVPAPEHYNDASHTYCPRCAEVARREIEAFKAAYVPPTVRRSGVGMLHDMFHQPRPLNRLNRESGL